MGGWTPKSRPEDEFWPEVEAKAARSRGWGLRLAGCVLLLGLLFGFGAVGLLVPATPAGPGGWVVVVAGSEGVPPTVDGPWTSAADAEGNASLYRGDGRRVLGVMAVAEFERRMGAKP